MTVLNKVPTLLLYPILWEESGLDNPPSSVQDYVAGINFKRAQTRSHLLSSMSSFNPTIPTYTVSAKEVSIARSLWQQGLIAYIKTQGQQGQEDLLSACQRLHALPDDHIVRMIGYCFSQVLILPRPTTDFNPLLSCMMDFEQLLSHVDPSQTVPAENILRDVLFYVDRLAPHPIAGIETQFNLSQAWDEDRPIERLPARVGYYARRIMKVLAAPDSETMIQKQSILPDLLPVLDGLLFLQEFPLRAQIEARYDKCPNPLLLIAVPAQKLMAECMRLAIYDKSPY